MTGIEQFLAAVSAATEGTPYAVTRTAAGFDVSIDVADAAWYALLYKQGLHKVFVHHVTVDEQRQRYTVLDDGRELEWRAGAELHGGVPQPFLGARLARRIGTSREISFRKEYALDQTGHVGKVLDYSFDSAAGNRLIDGAAQRLGLHKRLPTVSRVALGVAALAAVGALAAGVTLLTLALLGRL